MGGDELRILSWNVNGLGDRIKRGIVLRFLRRHSPDIVLLQETHLIGNACQTLNRRGYRLVAHAGFTSGSRGAGILVRSSLPFAVDEVKLEDRGRCAVLTGRWEGKTLSVLSVYVPPGLQTLTYADLCRVLLDLPEGLLILGGDLNSVVSGTFDRHPPRDLPRAQGWLSDLLETFGLIDAWRLLHPTQLQYTFHSGAHGSLSRLDYFLMPAVQSSSIREIRQLPRGISVHSPLWLRYEVGRELRVE